MKAKAIQRELKYTSEVHSDYFTDGRVTVCLLTAKNGERFIGTAIRSHADASNLRLGCEIARGRAYKNIERAIIGGYCDL